VVYYTLFGLPCKGIFCGRCCSIPGFLADVGLHIPFVAALFGASEAILSLVYILGTVVDTVALWI